MWLLSPTEHDLQSLLRDTSILHRISSVPEANGADIIIPTTKGLVGYQRKTLPDLKSSLIDGRLYRELAQLRTSPVLYHSFLIIEWTPRRITTTGEPTTTDLPRSALISVISKCSLLGIGYLPSSSLGDSVKTLTQSSTYLSSDRADTLRRAGPERNDWGSVGNSDYLSYVLQSFPGVGPKLADAIVSHFHGSLPLTWTCTLTELLSIPGVGPKTAETLYSFFNVVLRKVPKP